MATPITYGPMGVTTPPSGGTIYDFQNPFGDGGVKINVKNDTPVADATNGALGGVADATKGIGNIANTVTGGVTDLVARLNSLFTPEMAAAVRALVIDYVIPTLVGVVLTILGLYGLISQSDAVQDTIKTVSSVL